MNYCYMEFDEINSTDIKQKVPYKIYFNNKQHFVRVCVKQVRDRHGSKYLSSHFFQAINCIYEEYEKLIDRAEFNPEVKYKCPLSHVSYKLSDCKNKEGIIATINGIWKYVELFQKDEFPSECCWSAIGPEPSSKYFNGAAYARLQDDENLEVKAVRCLLSEHLTPTDFGVYLLYGSDENLIYIGKSKTLISRICESAFYRGAEYVQFIKTKTEADIHIIEPYLIAVLNPPLNTEFKSKDKPSFSIEVPPASGMIKLKLL